jgi:hypothetical protein
MPPSADNVPRAIFFFLDAKGGFGACEVIAVQFSQEREHFMV